jgi:hypothetical protein
MSSSPALRPITLDVKKIDEVSAKDGIVVATLHVSLLDWPSHDGRVLLNLSYEDADALLVQLQNAVVQLKNQFRRS